jgi:hypothetical protein
VQLNKIAKWFLKDEPAALETNFAFGVKILLEVFCFKIC